MASTSLMFSSPGMPKTCVTPSFSRHSTIRSAVLREGSVTITRLGHPAQEPPGQGHDTNAARHRDPGRHQHAAEFPDDLRRISAQIRDTRNRRRAGRNPWRCPAEDDRRARQASRVACGHDRGQQVLAEERARSIGASTSPYPRIPSDVVGPTAALHAEPVVSGPELADDRGKPFRSLTGLETLPHLMWNSGCK